MSATEAQNGLRRLIRAETEAAGGVLPFARFMELALYAPALGYYERGREAVGRDGDFYTSVTVGSVFGELLAFQFADWLENAPERTGRKRIVEAGAHDGRLARDILTWLRQWRPTLAAETVYLIVEPSAVRRRWQATTLAGFEDHVGWASDLGELADSPVAGSVIFANELLDAFPVHRIGWDARERRWFEWGVQEAEGKLGWARCPSERSSLPAEAWPKLPPELLAVLPDGFTTEVSPAAAAWWRDAARALGEGWLVTFDYGLRAEEFFAPNRAGGTLRGYHRHRLVEDILARPGEQDLTAQVNFTALEETGAAEGLATVAFSSQRRWLTEVMSRTAAPAARFAAWHAVRVRQFQTLTHPEHLGRAFRVLAQQRTHPGPD